MENVKELVVIIAEDDDGHAELIKDGLLESGVRNQMVRFRDGQETCDYLNSKKDEIGTANGQSFLLLLDINMPRMDGVEVLKRIKADGFENDIPVIMLTTTDDPREVEHCYQLGCNAYVTKPVDFAKFSETLHRLGLFIQIVKV